jgi:hypothetical protein
MQKMAFGRNCTTGISAWRLEAQPLQELAGSSLLSLWKAYQADQYHNIIMMLYHHWQLQSSNSINQGGKNKPHKILIVRDHPKYFDADSD